MPRFRSTTVTEVLQPEFRRFKALVQQYAPSEHVGMSVAFTSVAQGDRRGVFIHARVLIDVDASVGAEDEVRDAAEETVAHAFRTLGSGQQAQSTTIQVVS